MLWQADIIPADDQPDREADRVRQEASESGIHPHLRVSTAYGYLLQGDLSADQIQKLASEFLSDPVVQQAHVGPPSDPLLAAPRHQGEFQAPQLVHVLPKPGVMDPVAQSAQTALADVGMPVQRVRTFRKYWLESSQAELPLDEDTFGRLSARVLANEAIEEVFLGPLPFDELTLGSAYHFRLQEVPLLEATDQQLVEVSQRGQLALSLEEMQTIRQHFRQQQRNPTDCELETLAQTWSEHCSHKTLAGPIDYQDDQRQRSFENMLKETIFAATDSIRRQLGPADWCVSVFQDNAGIVAFDDHHHAVFKVETHNHPSAIEPYGGANTGIGGVIRDPLGTGLGAKPVANTNVFCLASPELPYRDVPPGALHPLRVLRGVVAGVRDYGNRMGIPTVNGALYFDSRYVGNPLVYCGNVGLIPVDRVDKFVQDGDLIVVVGGRTGRDGIHGATFSSIELTEQSEQLSGGAVQIGNAVTEKMVVDVLLQARDRGLYRAITDCGAGGLSSAVGEMGQDLGAEVQLEVVPLKYEGLSYTEIWISEAQERMVLAVPPENWDELSKLCAWEQVEATVIGRFVQTGRLRLTYQQQVVTDLSMEFLHRGRPRTVRQAIFRPQPQQPLPLAGILAGSPSADLTPDLLAILGSPNVASKEWVIRQYDHEVQGGSVIKPLVGPLADGPSDAAVIRPRLESRRGLVIACGMNPRYGDYDPYHMATSAIDEALRNCIAVGADPTRVAILDNFCWGNTNRPETLGSLVRAAIGCHDLAIELGTPFISGKDSLNNEFSYLASSGEKISLAIPPSLLISALGQVDDVSRCVTMDLKADRAGPPTSLYQVGLTRDELGGSHWSLVRQLSGGQVPTVRSASAKETFRRLHAAIQAGLVASCHDLSEGGLAVALAEMAIAGRVGAQVDLSLVPAEVDLPPEEATLTLLFSESNTRFVCEVFPEHEGRFQETLEGIPCQRIGTAGGAEPDVDQTLLITGLPTSQSDPALGSPTVIRAYVETLRQAWQRPLQLG